MIRLINKINIFNKSKNKKDGKELEIGNLDEFILLKIRGNECIAISFLMLYDPFNMLSSKQINKIEEYTERFSSLFSMLDENIAIVYMKMNEQYDNVLRKVENKINRLRIAIELGDNDAKKLRELKILEKIHENLLNSRKVYRLAILFIVKVIDSCDSINESLNKKIVELINLIHTYLNLKVSRVNLRRILGHLHIIPVLDGKIVIDKRRNILIIGNNIAHLLPFNKEHSSITDIDLSGVYIGYDTYSNKPVLLSPEKHLKFHGVIIGPTGKGKTTLLSSIFIRTDILNYKVVAIDFKGDMSRYLANYATIINSVDIRALIKKYSRGINVNKWIFNTARIWSNILGLNKAESYVLFKILQKIIIEDKDIYETIKYLLNDSKIKFNVKTYDRIIESISFLNLQNSVRELPRGSYVLDLEYYPDYMKELLSSMILSYEMNTSSPLSDFNKLILVDEAWRLKKVNPNILSMLYREGRSLGIGVFSTSQLLRDLSSTIIENANLFIIFGSHSKDYINDVRMILDFTEKELERLSNLKTGEAAIVLKDLKRPIWVKIVPEISLNKNM